MTVDTDAANNVLGGVRPFPVVITIDGGFASGLTSLSAGATRIIPEASRVTVSLTKHNMTHGIPLTESRVIVGDVVAPEVVCEAQRIKIGEGLRRLPADWIEQVDDNQCRNRKAPRTITSVGRSEAAGDC